MKAPSNNVTEIRQFSNERRSGGGLSTPLEDSRELSLKGLRNAIGESLEPIKLQLLEMLDKALGLEMYHLYMDALELARDHRVEIMDVFGKHYVQRFNQECRQSGGHIRSSSTSFELSLLEPDDLEETLASGNLANAINNACVEELFGLDKRIGMLINDPDLERGDNPLGPEVISKAVMEALNEQNSPMKARLLMTTLLSKHLPERVKEVYRDVNQHLVKKNVLPTIRVGMHRSASTQQAGQQTGQQTGGVHVGTGSGGDVLAMLQQLMGLGGGAASVPVAGTFIPGPAMPGESAVAGSGMAGGMPSIQPGSFLHSLNQLQRGQVGEFAHAGLDAAVLNAISQGSGQINVLHGLRGVAGSMTSMDAMTLDIVAMVFDYILEDRRIPDAIKTLIVRLQIPVLKVAMLDRAFFSQKNHPTRRLLDTMAEAAIGWDASEGHEGGLYRKIEQLTEDILTRFDDRVDVFIEALGELNDFLAEESREAVEAMVPSVLAVKTREQIELSRHAATEEVQTRLLGRNVPGSIVLFLTDHWQRVLAEIHHKAGEDSEAWRNAVDTMSDLIWSVAPKIDPNERKQLVMMLPGLLRRLDAGVRELGLSQEERDGFFSGLVKCHADAVKAGLPEASDQQAQPMMIAAIEKMGVPMLTGLPGFEPVEPVEELVAEAPGVLQELVEGVDEPPAEEIAIGDVSWGGGELESQDAAVDLSRLKKGTWIEYVQDDGSDARAKLSWISPMKGMYLFTNRHGQRAISINSDALMAKLRDGEVRILNDIPLIDRAVGDLVERLQRRAA
jgi:hypothetical protein